MGVRQLCGYAALGANANLPFRSMLTFLLAFSFECFGSGDRTSIFTTAAVWIAVALLIGWTIYTGWESGGETSVWDNLHRLWDHLFPQKAEGDAADMEGEGSSSTAAGNEKTKLARWWARRVRPSQAFPHSNDPPSTAETPTGVPGDESNV